MLSQFAWICSIFWQFNKCFCVFDVEDKTRLSESMTEMIVLCLLCRTWLRCRSGRDSDSCCPASSNVSSSAQREKKKEEAKVSPNDKTHIPYRYYSTSNVSFMRKIPSVLNSTHVNSFGEGVFPPCIQAKHFRLGSFVGLLGVISLTRLSLLV